MDPGCVEHVWVLHGLVRGSDGLLTERFECRRCGALRVVVDGDDRPDDPDLPG